MYFRLHAQYATSELGEGASREVLALYLRHVRSHRLTETFVLATEHSVLTRGMQGDVVVMEGAGIQEYYE